MGYHLARRLSYENNDVTLIDRNEERVNWIQENLDVRAIYGSASSPAILEEAGIVSASLLIAVTDSDEVNLVACYVAGVLNPVIRKVARLRDQNFSELPKILDEKHLDIDLVINPDNEAVKKLVNVLQIPAATDVIDFATAHLKLFGVKLAADSPLVGHSLIQIRLNYPHRKVLIPAVFRESEILIPRGGDVLMAGDNIYMMAEKESVPALLDLAGVRSKPLKRFMIYGGTSVGVQVARALENNGITNIKLIESDPDKCERIAAELNHTMVLKADALDEELLKSEGIADMDAFLAMTNGDEQNALSAILAKRMGSFRVAALTNKVEYHRLVSAIGVDITINPRLVGVSRILQYIRRGKVLSLTMLPGEGVEIVEYEAMETSDIVQRPLAKIKFPRGSIVGAIERGDDFIIPDGRTEIMPGDRVVVFARKGVIPKIEKLFLVKLEYF
jgi:trk system potassium uptake protein TrkA